MQIVSRDFELLKKSVENLPDSKDKQIIQFLINTITEDENKRSSGRTQRQNDYRRKHGMISLEEYHKKRKQALADSYAERTIKYVEEKEKSSKYL